MLAATSGLPGRRRDFLVQCQAKARRCQRRTVSGRTISRHRRQPDQHRYNTTHKSRSQRWRRKRRGAFFWQTASWWRSARISACRAARVRKLEATKVKRATKRELIVVATMISRMGRNPCVFRSDGVFGMHNFVKRASDVAGELPKTKLRLCLRTNFSLARAYCLPLF